MTRRLEKLREEVRIISEREREAQEVWRKLRDELEALKVGEESGGGGGEEGRELVNENGNGKK